MQQERFVFGTIRSERGIRHRRNLQFDRSAIVKFSTNSTCWQTTMDKRGLSSKYSRLIQPLLLLWVMGWASFVHSQEPYGNQGLRAEVIEKLKKACRFYAEKVSCRGGYPYFSSSDGSTRWGENELLKEAAIIQPPGTPSVGSVLLRAYQATSDEEYLEWAIDTGEALKLGQLKSGGWAQVVYFEKPEKGRMGSYRKRSGGEWNQSSLDDNQTQAAIVFLIELDLALELRNQDIHECAIFALDSLLNAQLPNGGFPQGWRAPARKFSPSSLATQPASYPDYDWKTEGKLKNYWDYATLNDGLVGDVAEALIRAYNAYRDERYLVALRRLGDFLVLAQMPEPQPAWCQQYNDYMQPIWARKFEPPAISGVESQDAMSTLLRIAEVTGEDRYLKPLPQAIEFLRTQCVQADGKLARFYELKSNKPLYMDKQYQLTYDDSNPPSHYGWKQKSRLDQIEREYQRVLKGGANSERPQKISEDSVRKVLDSLSSDGSWSHRYAGEKLMGSPKFKMGESYVSSAEFCDNISLLINYLNSYAK